MSVCVLFCFVFSSPVDVLQSLKFLDLSYNSVMQESVLQLSHLSR